ncbi:MAG: hypothetical protein ACI4TE_07325 [Alphaproteobacteria bacterium]
MKKGKIHFIRLLFSAVVGAVLFYVIARGIFLFFWNFDLISERHWTHIWNKWRGGWVIHKPKEVLFFIAVLLLIPGFLLTWFTVYVFPWLKFFRLPLTYLEKKKKERLQAQSLAAAVGPADKQKVLSKKKEPEKVIKISAEKLQHIDQLRGKKAGVQHAITAQSAAAKTGTAAPSTSTGKILSKEDEAVARFDLWEKLVQSLETEKIFILRQMKIKNFSVNTFAITREGVFLLCEGPAAGRSWEIDEAAEPPVWKTETAPIPSPLRPLIEAKAVLQKYFAEKMPQYSGLDVNCCMILDHGNVTNPDELLKYLETWDISVLRMGSCQTASLPDTHALIEYIKSQPASSQALNDAVAVAILDLMETENGA